MNWQEHIQSLLAAGATINGIAEKIGRSGNAVREIIYGRTRAPSGDAAVKLANLRPHNFSQPEGGVSAPANTPEAMARALAARGITVPPEEPPRAGAAASAEAYDPDAGRIVPFEELP